MTERLVTVKVKCIREEYWIAETQVPAELVECKCPDVTEIQAYVEDNDESVFDEFNYKHTYDCQSWMELHDE